MKLKDLQGITGSKQGDVQWAIVYRKVDNQQVATCSSIEYAMKTYGEMVVKRIASTYRNGKDCIVFYLA